MKRTFVNVLTAIFALVVAGSLIAMAGVFEENWDGASNSFTFVALFPTSPTGVDGSRCQYNDPDNPDSNAPGRSTCQPFSGNDWHVHDVTSPFGPKSFSGDSSLHLGRHPGPDESFDDYTTAQLSAALSPPIAIGPTVGEEGAKLSFWHIVALADDRTFNVPAGQTADRALAQVALSDASGTILSDWMTIAAFKNNYTNTSTTTFINCTFDPTDDGNTEDDLSTPPGVQPQLGPSSTCFPGISFNFMGDWTSTDKTDVGNATTGNGKLGNTGTGVWVESKFDLSAFAGQTIRIRLLISGLEINGPSGLGWSDLFGNTLGNATRGWLLDDFRVTGTE